MLLDQQKSARLQSDSSQKKIDVLETTLKRNIEKITSLERQINDEFRSTRQLKKDRQMLEAECQAYKIKFTQQESQLENFNRQMKEELESVQRNYADKYTQLQETCNDKINELMSAQRDFIE